jgi:hypothetical protein
MRNELWQECFGYWQNRFIHHNILILGYTAWLGYANEGRGMVVCNVMDFISPLIDWSVDNVTYNRIFIAQAQAVKYLQQLQLEGEAVTALESAIATYGPTQAIVMLVNTNYSNAKTHSIVF